MLQRQASEASQDKPATWGSHEAEKRFNGKALHETHQRRNIAELASAERRFHRCIVLSEISG